MEQRHITAAITQQCARHPQFKIHLSLFPQSTNLHLHLFESPSVFLTFNVSLHELLKFRTPLLTTVHLSALSVSQPQHSLSTGAFFPPLTARFMPQ